MSLVGNTATHCVVIGIPVIIFPPEDVVYVLVNFFIELLFELLMPPFGGFFNEEENPNENT